MDVKQHCIKLEKISYLASNRYAFGEERDFQGANLRA